MTSISDLIHKGGFTQRQSKVLAALGGGSSDSGPLGVDKKFTRISGSLVVPPASTVAYCDFSTDFAADPGDTLAVDLSSGSICYPEVNKRYLVEAQLSFILTDEAGDAGKPLGFALMGPSQRINGVAMEFGGEYGLNLQLLDFTPNLAYGVDLAIRGHNIPGGATGIVQVLIREF